MMTAGCSREKIKFKYEKKYSAIRNDLLSMAEKGSAAYQIVTKMNNNESCEDFFRNHES